MYEPKLIAPLSSGLVNYYKPFLIGDDAFENLEDCYSSRGSIQKRQGTTVLGRIPVWRVINTVVAGAVTTTANHNLATNDMVWIEGNTNANLNNKAFNIAVTGVATFNLLDLDTGAAITFSGTGGNIYLQVVGLPTYDIPGSPSEQLVAFTAKKAYLFTAPSTFTDISFNPAAAAISWTGTKDNFFWFANYANALWVTNFVDVIRYWNGSSTVGWSVLQPTTHAGNTLDACLIIIPYKERLVVLNTKETSGNFRQRARWSQIGTPYTLTDATHAPPTPFGVDLTAWDDVIPGKGGFNDADTSEQIQTARIINDVLIVGFQYSTWRLRYTGNEVLPFVWERISTTLGSETIYGSVSLDDHMLTFSRRGITRANVNDVNRFDQKIPDQIDNMETGVSGEGLQRCWGVRDFQKQLVYWTYGDQASNKQTPNKMLCYNYLEDSWATFNLPLSCLGNFRLSADGLWNNWFTTWATDTTTWNSPLEQQNTIIVLGGRVDSNVIVLMDDTSAVDWNGSAFNFVIKTKQFNPYFNQACSCRLGYVDIYCESEVFSQVPIASVTNGNPTTITTSGVHGLVAGQQVTIQGIANMGALNNFQYNILTVPTTSTFTLDYVTTGQPTATPNTGYVTVNSEITVRSFANDNDDAPVVQRKVSTGLSGENNKYVRIFLDVNARFHQLVLTLSDGSGEAIQYPRLSGVDNELSDPIKGKASFTLNGIVLHTRKMSRLK